MKSKFEPSELSGIEFKPYRAKLYKELARMKAEHADASNPTSFLLISEFQYSDLAGKKIPFLVVGTLKPEWKKYFKSDIKTRKNRDWAMGKCSFGAAGEFNFEVNAGKITSTWINIIDKLLLNPAKLSANVVEKLVGDGENVELDADDEATAPASEPAASAAPTASDEADTKSKKPSKEKVVKALKSKIEEAGASLSDLIKTIKGKLNVIQDQVAPKIKNKAPLSQQEFIAVKQGLSFCDEFLVAYKKTAKMIQKTFSKGRQEIQQRAVELKKIGMVVKAKKQPQSKILADAFFSKQANREATKEETAVMQNSLQLAIEARVNTLKDKKARNTALKAIQLAASVRGPKFTTKDVDVAAAALPTN